jgi:integrase
LRKSDIKLVLSVLTVKKVKRNGKIMKRVSKGKDMQPIRDKMAIEGMKKILSKNERNYFLFVLGINIGRRMGDILKLKVKDVRGKDRLFMCYEQKTGKRIDLKLNDKIKKEIKTYCNGKYDDEYLFTSRNKVYGLTTHILYKQAYTILTAAAKKIKLKNFATHTLRKTFGYWHYQQNHDLEALRKILNHDSIADTRRYIGVEQDEIDRTIDKFGGL